MELTNGTNVFHPSVEVAVRENRKIRITPVSLALTDLWLDRISWAGKNFLIDSSGRLC